MKKWTLVVLCAVSVSVLGLGLALIAGGCNEGGCCGSMASSGGGSQSCHGTDASSSSGTSQSSAKVVNTRCPIMGSAINPAKVPDSLTREYKGQKIGFCCTGCPAAWDRLSDADKDAKLAKVVPTAK